MEYLLPEQCVDYLLRCHTENGVADGIGGSIERSLRLWDLHTYPRL